MKYYIILTLLLAFSLSAKGENYPEKAHELYKKKDYPKAGAFYEKAYKREKIGVYLDNAVAAYLCHAFNLSNDRKYKQAIDYCTKVLSLEPGNNSAKELLSEIYFSRGSDHFFMGYKEKALSDMENSFKYSVLPEQRQRVLQELKDWKIQSY